MFLSKSVASMTNPAWTASSTSSFASSINSLLLAFAASTLSMCILNAGSSLGAAVSRVPRMTFILSISSVSVFKFASTRAFLTLAPAAAAFSTASDCCSLNPKVVSASRINPHSFSLRVFT